MQILFLAHRLPYPPNKGDKARSFKALQALSARHEVDLFCFYDDPEDQSYVEEMLRYCRRCYAEPLSGLRSRAQALAAVCLGRSFTPSFFYSPSMERRVRESLKAGTYDLVFAFSSSMAQYAQAAAGLPLVLDMVDVDSEKWAQYARHTSPPGCWLWSAEARRLGEYERRLVEDASVTLLCTETEAATLRDKAADHKVEVLENWIDCSYFDPAGLPIPADIASRQPYVIFTGSMDYFPNVDAVTHFHCEVFPRIRAMWPEVGFVVAGRNPARAVQQLAKDPAVRVTGAVPDIRPYLRGAAAAVAPLRIARGVQNKIFEAMAMGLPVAASGKAAEALPDSLAALLFIEDDPQSLAEGLVELIRRGPKPPVQRIRQAVVEHFDGLHWGQQLENFIARAVQDHRRKSEGDGQKTPDAVRLEPVAEEIRESTGRNQ